jgi:HEXXH motif-containing protein
MNLPHHRIPFQDFMALAAGGGGTDAIGELVAIEYSKHMTFLANVIVAAEGGEQYSLARTGYDLLAAAVRENREAALAVIRYPSVGVWARRTLQIGHGGRPSPGTEPGQMRGVAAAAAIRAGLRAEIEVPVTGGRVVLPSLGVALVPGHSALVRSGPGGATIDQVTISRDPYQDAPGWLGLRRVRVGPLNVVIDDLDPFRMPDARDLAPRPESGPWDAVLAGVWQVLEHGHADVAAEIAALVSAIVPLSRPLSGEVSSTSPEAFGAVALSVPPDPVIGAVTLTHEIQHVKLGALLDVLTLTLPDDGRRYYAPWRNDPRPLGGLLQGAYAYLGISGFWRRQRRLPGNQLRADVEYVRWRSATALAVETLLSSERLTRMGREFVSAMARTLGAWQDEPVSAGAMTLARRDAESHLARWQSAHGPVAAG